MAAVKSRHPAHVCANLEGIISEEEEEDQAVIAQEDVEGYFVLRRVSFIIAAAVGRQLAARRV